MQLLYEGKDITEAVTIAEARAFDHAGGRADSLELRFSNARDWFGWKPKSGDRVEIADSGYATGAMYVDTFAPDKDGYLLCACAIPAKAREKRWASFERVTLSELMRTVAGELDMNMALYGVDQRVKYPYIERRDETAVGFLQRVLELEGATLKCYDGTLTAVGVEWAQQREPVRTFEIGSDMPGARYTAMVGRGYASCSVKTLRAGGMARDESALGAGVLRIQNEPVFDGAQAARWARGRLLTENRKRESLRWRVSFEAALTALVRVDLTGLDALAGEWMVESAEHDFIEHTTECVLVKCIYGII